MQPVFRYAELTIVKNDETKRGVFGDGYCTL
jgi:hypothetical protein